MTRLALIVLAGLALLAAAPAAAPAATQWTMDKSASVRNHPGDFILGYAYGNGAGPNTAQSAHVNEQARFGNWIYGLVDLNFGRWGGRSCGWVLVRAGAMHRNGRTVGDACPAPASRDSGANPLAPRNLFTDGSYLYGTGGGTVIPARVDAGAGCQSVGGPRAYGNFDPPTGAFHNRYGAMPNGRGTVLGVRSTDPRGYSGFGLRYVSGGAVLLKDSHNPAGAPVWFFMRRQCVVPIGPRFSSGLRVTAARLRGMTIAARGRTAVNLPRYVGTQPQRLFVLFSCGRPRSGTVVSFHRAAIVVRGKRRRIGVWKARFRVPEGCRRAKRGQVTVGYRGNLRNKPGLGAKRVRRR